MTAAQIDQIGMLLLGLFGTGHCLGMCGPLVVAFPGRHEHMSAHLLYHAGRISMYALIGGLLGGLSQGLIYAAAAPADTMLIWVGRFQVALSLPVAIFLIFMGLNRLGLLDEPQWMARAMPQKIPGFRLIFARATGPGSPVWLFPMGLLLGLLPCGLSYGAFAFSLATGSAVKGAESALLFGIGTMPGLLLLGTGARVIFQRFRRSMDILSGLIMIGMAVSLLGGAWTAMV